MLRIRRDTRTKTLGNHSTFRTFLRRVIIIGLIIAATLLLWREARTFLHIKYIRYEVARDGEVVVRLEDADKPYAENALFRALEKDPDPRVRASAARSLYFVKDRDAAVRALIHALERDYDPLVGDHVIWCIYCMVDYSEDMDVAEKAVAAMSDVLANHPEPRVRYMAAWFLGGIGECRPEFDMNRLVTPLTRALNDKDPKVGQCAEKSLKYLAQLGARVRIEYPVER